MADIRIKDLTTTASSTASDDFIAVDGTTNGTRKLSAFSPTFGGNATVTGTLTAGGGILSAGVSGSVTVNSTGTGALKIDNPTNPNLYFYSNGALKTQINYVASSSSFVVDHADQSEIKLNVFGGGTTTVGGRLLVSSTTASTTTSTGALVIGNGTSGGLGVGGAASIGGPILVGTSSDVYLSRVGAGILDIRSASSPGTAARLDVTGTTSAGLGLRQTGTRDWFISAESSELRVSCLTAASIFAFNSGTPVAMRDSTASTSTSSGALVVSGGVGVAGAIFSGGYIHAGGDSDFYLRGAGSGNGLLRGNYVSADVDGAFRIRNAAGSTTYFEVASTGLIAAIPAIAPSLTVNGTMTFERTSNTSLKISVRGTDGTTRSVSLTLA